MRGPSHRTGMATITQQLLREGAGALREPVAQALRVPAERLTLECRWYPQDPAKPNDVGRMGFVIRIDGHRLDAARMATAVRFISAMLDRPARAIPWGDC